MPKLPPTAANVAFVANQLSDGGPRLRVSLAQIRDVVDGTAEEVSALRDDWLGGDTGHAATAPPNPHADIIDDLRRQLAAARRDETHGLPDNGRHRTAPKGRGKAGGRNPERNADPEELRVVVQAALEVPVPDVPKSFMLDVWERRVAGRHGSHTLPDDVERSPERKIAAKIAAEAKGEPGPREPKLPRVLNADWKGASNEWFARHVATVLRRAGQPLMATDISRAVAARGGPEAIKPGLGLAAQLAGSRIVPVGNRGLYWFEGEDPLRPLHQYVRRDTPRALARKLAARVFARVVEILKDRAPRTVAVAEIKAAIGRDVEELHPEWVSERLGDEISRGGSDIRRVKGGYAWQPQDERNRAGKRPHG